jgi:hypothetical protein
MFLANGGFCRFVMLKGEKSLYAPEKAIKNILSKTQDDRAMLPHAASQILCPKCKKAPQQDCQRASNQIN